MACGSGCDPSASSDRRLDDHHLSRTSRRSTGSSRATVKTYIRLALSGGLRLIGVVVVQGVDSGRSRPLPPDPLP